MHAGLLDVLHDGRDVGVLAVAQGVDVDLDRALEEAVDERRPLHAGEGADDVVGRVADAHRAAAEHVRRANQDGVADPLGERDGFRRRSPRSPLGAADLELGEQAAEALAVLGEVDGVKRRAEDLVTRRSRSRVPASAASGRRTG